jgi:hypothetical protein
MYVAIAPSMVAAVMSSPRFCMMRPLPSPSTLVTASGSLATLTPAMKGSTGTRPEKKHESCQSMRIVSPRAENVRP